MGDQQVSRHANRTDKKGRLIAEGTKGHERAEGGVGSPDVGSQ